METAETPGQNVEAPESQVNALKGLLGGLKALKPTPFTIISSLLLSTMIYIVVWWLAWWQVQPDGTETACFIVFSLFTVHLGRAAFRRKKGPRAAGRHGSDRRAGK